MGPDDGVQYLLQFHAAHGQVGCLGNALWGKEGSRKRGEEEEVTWIKPAIKRGRKTEGAAGNKVLTYSINASVQ